MIIFTVGKNYSCARMTFRDRSALAIQGQLLVTYGLNGEHRGKPISGATILLMRLKDDGFLHQISGKEVRTDQQGFFRIDSPEYDNQDLVIVAEKGQEEWRAIISKWANSSGNSDIVPVSYETTIATDLYLSLIKTGHPERASYTSILESIQAELAVMGYAKGGGIPQETTEIERILRTPVAHPHTQQQTETVN